MTDMMDICYGGLITALLIESCYGLKTLLLSLRRSSFISHFSSNLGHMTSLPPFFSSNSSPTLHR